MTQNETFTQTTNTPIFTEPLQPVSHNTNRLAVGVVPCADAMPAPDAVLAPDQTLALEYPSASVVTPAHNQPSTSIITPTLVPCPDPGLASISNSPDPFAICQQPLTNAIPQPVHWLWQHRLPLAGITLLDGDRSTGKTLLAHQIAAAVSSGSPMPDGTPTIQGGEYPSS